MDGQTRGRYEQLWAGRLFPIAGNPAGYSRSKVFALLASGKLKAKRFGNKNLLIGESLGAHVDALPDWTPSRPSGPPQSA